MALKEIVKQIESCGYECEAGPLENNQAFQRLKELAAHELPDMSVLTIDPNGRYIFQMPKATPRDEIVWVRAQLDKLFNGDLPFVVIADEVKVVRIEGANNASVG